MDEPLETTPSPKISPEQLEEIKSMVFGQGKGPANPGGDGISALLNNPELMSRLPQIMEMVKPMLGTASPALPPAGAKPLSREEERDRLLLSLRPFLSKERQDLVEAILKLSKLGDVLKHLS
ncbi:MAG: hypothetical protein IJR88_02555 [Clostridia bacterium]|nr:hypothetical protein [Clostridia bacterium]